MWVDSNRSSLRDQYFASWQKYQQAQPLTALESQLISVILMHPEYHLILNQPEKYREKEYLPELGETNPFLHMSLHMGLLEQVSTDRPKGIQDLKKTLEQQYNSLHAAEHAMMDCLMEVLWLSQKNNQHVDEQTYLQAVRNLVK